MSGSVGVIGLAALLQDKVMVIIGDAENLSGAISRRVGAEGTRVIVRYNSDRTKPEAEETVAAVRDASAGVHHRRSVYGVVSTADLGARGPPRSRRVTSCARPRVP